MAYRPNAGENTRHVRRFVFRGFLVLLVWGAPGLIGVAAAGDPSKTPKPNETPLVVTSAYGVDGVVLWLAADSGVTKDDGNNVTALVDKTRNFTLTTTDPDQEPSYVANGLNGRPVIRFNGDQSLYSPDNFGTDLNRDMTIIVVAMNTGARTRLQYPLYLGQNSTSHANRALSCYRGYNLFDGQWVACYGPPPVRNTFVVTGASLNPALTQATFYLDGALTMVGGLARENGNATFGDLSNGVTLGAAAGPCRGWLGDIAEELVYDRQLSPTEMQLIWSSLAGKYGLHPVAIAPSAIKP